MASLAIAPRRTILQYTLRLSLLAVSTALCVLSKVDAVDRNDDHHGHFNKVTTGRSAATTARSCAMSQGNWVYDESYPLYDSTKCRFIESEFDCVRNGRPDKLYLKLRWKPSSCNVPRFDGLEFLRRFRGKSIMFVGDSLSLNQWQSLTCMLHTAHPSGQYKSVRIGGLSVFTFLEYDVKVMLSRNAFLVDIVNTDAGNVLQLNSVKEGALWKNMDVLIFNTWHWWLHVGRKQPWNFIQDGGVLYKDMDRFVAYEKALNTWAKWVETNVDPTKTRVFFQGVSPDHNNASDWGDMTARNCAGQAKALNGLTYRPGPHLAQLVVERVLRSMGKQVTLLNVTELSRLRKDGHPSFFGHGGHHDSDCSHWCLAGVPDTWNLLLNAALLQT